MVIVAMVARWWRSGDTEVTLVALCVSTEVVLYSSWCHCGGTGHCGATVVVLWSPCHCGSTVVIVAVGVLWWRCGDTLGTVVAL